MLKKNNSTTGNQFIGWVTVSSRGQIAIPMELRKNLKIKDGDRLLAIQREDKDGFNLIQSDALDKVFNKYSK